MKKSYTINLKEGKSYEIVSDKDINVTALNNYSNFLEVDLGDDGKLIVAKDMIESVHIEPMEDTSEEKDNDSRESIFDKTDREKLFEKLGITEEQFNKGSASLWDHINNSRPVWDYEKSILTFR